MKKGKLFGFAVIALLLASMILFSACPEKQDPPAATATEYTITVADTANGEFEVDKKTAKENDVVTITAVPDASYRVYGSIEVTPAGGAAFNATWDAGEEYYFTMPKANVTISGSFVSAASGFNVTVTQATGGTITAHPTRALENEEVTLTAEPATGMKLQNFTVTRTGAGGGPVGTEGTGNVQTFKMPGGAVTVTAIFIAEGAVTHHITLTQSKGGTFNANTTSAIEGATITLTATPAPAATLEGYTFGSFTVLQGTTPVTVSGTTGNTRTFIMPAGDVTVTAAWTRTTADLYALGAFNLPDSATGWGFDGNGGAKNWTAFQGAKYLVIETKSASATAANFTALTATLIADGVAGTATALNGSGTAFARGTDTVWIVIELDKLTDYAAVKAKDDGRIRLGYGTIAQLNYVNAYLYKGELTPKPADAVDMTTYGFITKQMKIQGGAFEVMQYITVAFNTSSGTPATIPSVQIFAGEGLGDKMPADPSVANQYFTGWYNGATLVDETTPIPAAATLTAQYKASGWTPGATSLTLDLLEQNTHFHYATATAQTYLLPLADSTVITEKNYGNIRIRFPGGFNVADYANVTIKYRFAQVSGTTVTYSPLDPRSGTTMICGSGSYLVDSYFYRTWNGYGKWMTAADAPPVGQTGAENVQLSSDQMTAKGGLLRMGGRPSTFDNGPISGTTNTVNGDTEAGYRALGNQGEDLTIDQVNKGFTFVNTMTVNPQGLQVNKAGGNSNGHIRVTEIKFWNTDPVEAARDAVAALTSAHAWEAFAAANNLIKTAQTGGSSVTAIIASFKEKIEAKISANNFAEFFGWVDPDATPVVDKYKVEGSVITLNYVKTQVNTGTMTIAQAVGWAIPSKASGGSTVTATTLTYGIGNNPATDKVEYTLNITPVAQYNVVFAANAHGFITIDDGTPAGKAEIGHDTAVIVTKNVVRAIGSTTVSIVDGPILLGECFPALTITEHSPFNATSQVYTINVVREPVPEGFGAIEITLEQDQRWTGFPAEAFTVSQEKYESRSISLTGLTGTYTVQWYLNGKAVEGAVSNYYYIYAPWFSRGAHSLTVVVVKGGVTYSSPEIKFTVAR